MTAQSRTPGMARYGLDAQTLRITDDKFQRVAPLEVLRMCNAYDTALEREARLRAQNAALRAALELAKSSIEREMAARLPVANSTLRMSAFQAARAALQQSDPSA